LASWVKVNPEVVLLRISTDCGPFMLMVYTPGAKCWPEAVWKENGTFILAANAESCAWAAGAGEATARTAAIKPAGTFNIIELRMVFLLLEGVSSTAFTY
jgi:hypothetical protein